MQSIKQNHFSSADGEEVRRIESQIHNLLIDEEIYWQQRSRADWLREGDKNTKFFHAKASARKWKNKIWGVEVLGRGWTEKREEIEKEFSGYFQHLFKSSKPNQSQIKAAVQEMPLKITL